MNTDSHRHHPHILPLSVYIGVGSALFILTGITVGVAHIDLGGTWNLIIAMIVATIKATLVALFFMHLLYDNKLYAVVFSIGLFMLTAFIVITMFDTLRRDAIYEYKAPPITREATIYENLKHQESQTEDHADSQVGEKQISH